MQVNELSEYLDRYLDIHALSDSLLNGLQVENSGALSSLGLAVDACLESILGAAQQGCGLLIVHHGILWSGQVPICGHLYRRIRALIQADMSLYAAHLPLDAHPEVGNNIQIAARLALKDLVPFGAYGGTHLGIQGSLGSPLSLDDSLKMCQQRVGATKMVLRFGPQEVSHIAILTGSATDPSLFEEASRSGADLLVTGEPKQAAYSLAQEYGLNIFYGGHYQTETFGLKALGEHLSKRFDLEIHFIESTCPL
jgi:dinuclear metal center YbgI/SA1388 family protein